MVEPAVRVLIRTVKRFAIATAYRAREQNPATYVPDDVKVRAAILPPTLLADKRGPHLKMIFTSHQFAARPENGRVFHLQAHAAKSQDLTRFQRTFKHLSAVDEHAIGGIRVAHEHPPVAKNYSDAVRSLLEHIGYVINLILQNFMV